MLMAYMKKLEKNELGGLCSEGGDDDDDEKEGERRRKDSIMKNRISGLFVDL